MKNLAKQWEYKDNRVDCMAGQDKVYRTPDTYHKDARNKDTSDAGKDN